MQILLRLVGTLANGDQVIVGRTTGVRPWDDRYFVFNLTADSLMWRNRIGHQFGDYSIKN